MKTETLKWMPMISIQFHRPQPLETPRMTKIIEGLGNQQIGVDLLEAGTTRQMA
jgi:hypothetical protein